MFSKDETIWMACAKQRVTRPKIHGGDYKLGHLLSIRLTDLLLVHCIEFSDSWTANCNSYGSVLLHASVTGK